MFNKKNPGFTLIELMVVMVIISILITLAIPSYHDYVTRSKVGEGLVLSSPMKIAITDYYMTEHQFPKTREEAGILSPDHIQGRYVQSVEWIDGRMIKIIYNEQCGSMAHQWIAWTPSEIRGQLQWNCSVPHAQLFPYVPRECRTVASI